MAVRHIIAGIDHRVPNAHPLHRHRFTLPQTNYFEFTTLSRTYPSSPLITKGGGHGGAGERDSSGSVVLTN